MPFGTILVLGFGLGPATLGGTGPQTLAAFIAFRLCRQVHLMGLRKSIHSFRFEFALDELFNLAQIQNLFL